MEPHRGGWIVSIILALGASGVSTRAIVTPTYLVTAGSGYWTDGNFLWSFTGPGFSASGGAESPCCPTPIVQDGVILSFTSLSGTMSGGGSIGGVSYSLSFSGGLSISGEAFLPNPPLTISSGSFVPVSGPASFMGTLNACTPFSACLSGEGTDLFNFVINCPGIVTYDLSQFPGEQLGRYDVSNIRFTVTPEPTTALLFLTGLLMITLVLLRKH
jgi:hypothetical protein